MKSFYEALGFNFSEKSVDKGGKIYLGQALNLELEIRSLEKMETLINPQVQLSFEVKNIEQVSQQLQKLNAFFLMEPTEMPEGPMAILQDPDGRAVQLMQVGSPS